MLTGRCHCGAVTYEMPEQTIHLALCHCADCRRASGAPMVAWAMVPTDQVKIEGATRIYASSEHGRRHFCEACGTGLFYTNEAVFPGLIDVQTATLDDPGALPPTAHIQVAERISWMATAHDLPTFERYPG
ncbi:MAG: GFA family protein [Phenylobacterium sp.]|uniref:GFA family protein n=1 Tax=Phenylobacterium sp. TaxID=1871053 RepID=UPI002730BCA4|nr:GFA family protein [Phenylobacterium sp.]MDP2011602.1 GFA family protein [Phenylobacterium sp.]